MDITIPIHPVLEHYGWHIPSTRTTWQTIKCGAHDDTHGSCRVSDTYVYCLACDFRGDAVNVVRHYRPELSFREAKDLATDIAGPGSGPDAGSARSYPPRSNHRDAGRVQRQSRLR